MGYLTSWYDSNDIFPFHTVGHGPIDLYNMYITWIAGTTPEWLKIIPPDAQGGFLGRLLFIYSDERKRIPRPRPAPGKKELLDGLVYISKLAGEIAIPEETWQLFDAEYMAIADTEDPRQAGFYERIHDTWLKVGTLLAAGKGTLNLTPETLREAIDLVAEVAPNIVPALQYVGTSEHSQDSERILRQLARKGGSMTRSEVINANAWKMSAEDIDKVMKTLEARTRVRTTMRGRAQIYLLVPPPLGAGPEPS
jgi:hypothetical protein